jgi:nucleoside-diphosphate-sugar epimerase
MLKLLPWRSTGHTGLIQGYADINIYRPRMQAVDGKQTKSFCYVSDMIEGIYLLMMSDFAEPVNIGNPEEMTVLEFATIIDDELPLVVTGPCGNYNRNITTKNWSVVG